MIYFLNSKSKSKRKCFKSINNNVLFDHIIRLKKYIYKKYKLKDSIYGYT